jgi:hypothetical protein
VKEYDLVTFTESEIQRDRRKLEEAMVRYPVVGTTINKLRCEKAELQKRVNQLEQEILRLQYGRIPFHDLGQ